MTAIIGLGLLPVSEQWGVSLRELAHQAIEAALADAGLTRDAIDALVLGNAFSATLNKQAETAALIADYSGLGGVEAVHIEAADASGGMAVRYGSLLIAAGAAQTVLVVGAEKVTDVVGPGRHDATGIALDADYEAAHGATPAAMAALLMRRYMYEYEVELAAFENFSINAHANGSKNPAAMFRNRIKPGRFATAPVVAPPVNLFDSAPEGDGACALVLTSLEQATRHSDKAVRILGSGVGTDTLALHDRPNPLFLQAANLAAGRAYQAAAINPSDVDLLELHDAFTILSTLQLEASGFAEQGQGWQAATEGRILADGPLPISTFGGLKARGNPFGATGVYQVAEVALQLRGEAADNQIPKAQLGMTLNLAGLGSTAVAHVLSRL